MTVRDLIASALNGNAASFEQTLGAVMQEKMAAAAQAKFSPAVYEEEVDLEESKDEEDDEEDDDMKEEVEELDEISGAKIGTYLIKARKSEADLDKKIDKEYDKDDFNTPENKAIRKGLSRTLSKRRWGQGKAMDKLTGNGFAKVHATEK